MKDLVEKAGISAQFEIASAATSTEEIGNPAIRLPGASWLGVEPASIAKTLLDGPFCDSQSNAGNIDSVLQT